MCCRGRFAHNLMTLEKPNVVFSGFGYIVRINIVLACPFTIFAHGYVMRDAHFLDFNCHHAPQPTPEISLVLAVTASSTLLAHAAIYCCSRLKTVLRQMQGQFLA